MPRLRDLLIDGGHALGDALPGEKFAGIGKTAFAQGSRLGGILQDRRESGGESARVVFGNDEAGVGDDIGDGAGVCTDDGSAAGVGFDDDAAELFFPAGSCP